MIDFIIQTMVGGVILYVLVSAYFMIGFVISLLMFLSSNDIDDKLNAVLAFFFWLPYIVWNIVATLFEIFIMMPIRNFRR